jgi:hypothetical protein
MKCTVQMVSGGMIYIYVPSIMTIGQAFKEYEGYYLNNLRGCSVDITDYGVQMGSDGMVYILSFMTIGSGIQVILSLLSQ